MNQGSPTEVTQLPTKTAQQVRPKSPKSPVASWFSEHPVWTMLGAFVLVIGLVTTVILANIDTVSDNVTAVQTDVRELRGDVDEVKNELHDLNREVGYIKGRMDQTTSSGSQLPPKETN